MKIVNLRDIPAAPYESPKGKFGGVFQGLSLALGRSESSTDLNERHPFDVEISRIPAGKILCPFHSHSAQWEFYTVTGGKGFVRHAEGEAAIATGDTFLFKPGEPHQLRAADDEDLTFLIVADNPIGESCHYPDSGKWLVRSPERRLIRSESLDYFDGEE
ncbi:MAG: hypothetical protein SynsKO_18790 [Synoicihabitans sp.]